jgi:hypothetical protein
MTRSLAEVEALVSGVAVVSTGWHACRSPPRRASFMPAVFAAAIA